MSWNMAGRPSKWLAEDRPFTLPEVSSLGGKINKRNIISRWRRLSRHDDESSQIRAVPQQLIGQSNIQRTHSAKTFKGLWLYIRWNVNAPV